MEERTPSSDAPAPDLDDAHRVLYMTERTLPAVPESLTAEDTPFTVALVYIDEPDATSTAAATSCPMILPTARDVRIRIRALAEVRANY